MAEVSAHAALESRDCKVPGCLNDANTRYDRGTFAGLCDEHIEVKRRQVSDQSRRQWAERHPSGQLDPAKAEERSAAAAKGAAAANALRAQPGTLTELAVALLKATRAYDAAAAKVAKAEPRLAAARQEAEAAAREVTRVMAEMEQRTGK